MIVVYPHLLSLADGFANADKNSAGRGRSATPSSATTKRALSYVALAQRAPLTSSSQLSLPSSPPYAGPPIGRENIAPGGEVAVPFRLNGSEVHYAGRVVRPAPSSSSATPQWDVSIPDGDV